MNRSSFTDTIAIHYAGAIVGGLDVPHGLSSFSARPQEWDAFIGKLGAQIAKQSDGQFVLRPASPYLFKLHPMCPTTYLAVVDARLCEPPEMVTELANGIRLLSLCAYDGNLPFPVEAASADAIVRGREAAAANAKRQDVVDVLTTKVDTLFEQLGALMGMNLGDFVEALSADERTALSDGAFDEKARALEAFGLRLPR